MCMGHVDKTLLSLAKEMAVKLRKDFEEFKDEEFPKVKNLLNKVEAKLDKELQALQQKVEEQGRDLTETRQEVAENKVKVECVAQELQEAREINERKQQQHEKDLSETADKVKVLEQRSKETHARVEHVTQEYKQSREEDERRLKKHEEELEQRSKENLSEMTDKVQDLQQEFDEHKRDLAGAQAQLKGLALTAVETNTSVEHLTQEMKNMAEDTKEKFESSKRSLECLEEKVEDVSQEHKRKKLEDEEKAQHLEHKVDATREQPEQRHKRKVKGNIKNKKRRRMQGKKTFQIWCAYIEFCKFSAGLKVCFRRSHVKPPLPRGGSACECVWGWRASLPLPPSPFLWDPSLEVFNVTPLPFLVRLSDHNTTHVIGSFGSLSYYMYIYMIYNMPKVLN